MNPLYSVLNFASQFVVYFVVNATFRFGSKQLTVLIKLMSGYVFRSACLEINSCSNLEVLRLGDVVSCNVVEEEQLLLRLQLRIHPSICLVQAEGLCVHGLTGLLLGTRTLRTLGLRVERGHGHGQHQALRWQRHGRGECGGTLDARRLPILRGFGYKGGFLKCIVHSPWWRMQKI